MEWQAAFTLFVVVVALLAMSFEFAAPDLVLMAALISLGATGILTPTETFAGFANPAVAAIGALFMVSAALRETGALDLTLGRFLVRARTTASGVVRICTPVVGLSAFLNNAPIVAMMTPAVIDWAKKVQLSPSRFLIPLSYASILGSITTIIGTSTNLTVAGLITNAGMPEMGFFELLPVGAPLCIVGVLYLIFVAPRWLPDRVDPAEEAEERQREYTTSMIVQSDFPHLGGSVEDAGLRQLPGLFLVEIARSGQSIVPVGPGEVILAGDRLIFAGVLSTIVDLQRVRGLVPEDPEERPVSPDPYHGLVEAVISSSSPLVGLSIRDSNFRTVYDAAVIAVHRNGERVPGKIGEIALRPGDTLLMQAAPGFVRAHRNSREFYLVGEIDGSNKPRFERAWVALVALVAMVLAVSIDFQHVSVAAFVVVGFLVVTRCFRAQHARNSVDWSILVVIGAGLGIAHGMEKTGAARFVAHSMVEVAGELGPQAALILVYAACLVMAEMLHHNAAVAIMFPIAVATAQEVGADPRGFVMAVAVASCCAFASPVTYQTHLIVYGPGGYHFTDFVRVGLPLDLICGVMAVFLIPLVWPF